LSEWTWARCRRKGELQWKTGTGLVNWAVREEGEWMGPRHSPRGTEREIDANNGDRRSGGEHCR